MNDYPLLAGELSFLLATGYDRSIVSVVRNGHNVHLVTPGALSLSIELEDVSRNLSSSKSRGAVTVVILSATSEIPLPGMRFQELL